MAEALRKHRVFPRWTSTKKKAEAVAVGKGRVRRDASARPSEANWRPGAGPAPARPNKHRVRFSAFSAADDFATPGGAQKSSLRSNLARSPHQRKALERKKLPSRRASPLLSSHTSLQTSCNYCATDFPSHRAAARARGNQRSSAILNGMCAMTSMSTGVPAFMAGENFHCAKADLALASSCGSRLRAT